MYRIRRYFLSIIWSLFILVIVSVPGRNIPSVDIWGFVAFDKLVHVAIFAILTLLLIVNIVKQHSEVFNQKKAIVIATASSFTYSICTEMLQFIVPGRSVEWSDLLANLAGCGTGVLLFFFIYKWSEPKTEKH